jgi:P4 family phage/plasmid primase-like protien
MLDGTAAPPPQAMVTVKVQHGSSPCTANGPLLGLSRRWTRELVKQSAIDPAVITERGYRTVTWTPNDRRGHDLLAGLGIPSWARAEERGSGLLIPMYRATGERVSWQWRPDKAVRDRDGKYRRYASVRGQPNRLDVHSRNTGVIADPTVQLWITEGIKKADALTSRGTCVVALTGVFNWRSRHGTLGDWEDVPLKGRQVVVCFDADARSNMNVLRAMVRLGRWLKSKGVRQVRYLIVPAEVNGTAVKGADDFLAAGGTIDELLAAATGIEPNTTTADDTFTDARMAETVADDVLDGEFEWCKALGWRRWTGLRWEEATDETVVEAIRQYALDRFREVIDGLRSAAGQASNTNAVDGWRSMLSLGRQRSILTLARGIVERKAADFDADSDMLNTPSGIVDLTSGQLLPHDPDALITKITKGSYRPGYKHPDWTAALQALPAESRDWFQARVGQGITGRPTPDGILPILQGSGENGKSLLTTDGVVPALGDYADVASSKLICATKGTEHSTEMADLRGKRYLIAEEMTEGRALDVTTIKRIQDVGIIKARYVHKDNMTFPASHSLFATTNYVPRVDETDHGTWRRLALLKFPYTFRKKNELLIAATDRRGDPGLKSRIREGATGQHDAIVTWAVEGAMQVATDGAAALASPPAVVTDTLAWRAAADRILGYWTERLIADPDRCVLVGELLVDFNAWLRGNGHCDWSKETFAQKFGGHSETVKHGVESRTTRKLEGLTRPTGLGTAQATPAQARVWSGVRYRTPAEQYGDDPCDECDDPPTNPFTRYIREEFVQGSSHSAHKIADPSPNGSCAGFQQGTL